MRQRDRENTLASVCFYFQVHQPYRLRRYSVFDTDPFYFDELKNSEICKKVAEKCYLPANRLMLDLIDRFAGKFKISFSISGSAIEQFEKFAPEVLDTFKALAATGCVEFLAETYYHSLAFLYSRSEFNEQVKLHAARIESLFGQTPRAFRNTELIYSNDVAQAANDLGYNVCLLEGAEQVLQTRKSNVLYSPATLPQTKLLLRNFKLTDDIAFRFGNRNAPGWPLTAPKFAKAITDAGGACCNLFMDYETFGEHQWSETGIFEFLRHLPGEVLSAGHTFATVSELANSLEATDTLDVPHLISWADSERDLSAWLSNAMQSNALHELYKLEGRLKAAGNEALLADWRRLGTSDHVYYMCTKFFADGDVHRYFSPYESPYDSYINFMNVLDNLQSRVR